MPHHEPRMCLLPDEFTHLDILILEIKEVRVTIVRHIAMVSSGGTIVEKTEWTPWTGAGLVHSG